MSDRPSPVNLVDLHAAALRLAVPVRSLRELIRRGELRAVRLSERRLRVREDELARFVERRLA